MVSLKLLGILTIWALLILVGILVVVRLTGLIDHLLPAGDPPNTRFGRDADLPQNPNFFLACPADQLPDTDRAMESPAFNASVATVTQVMIDAAADHGMQLKTDIAGGMDGRIYFLARTSIMRFPDWVEVEPILSETGEDVTFCLMARSVYGIDDLGQNEKRTRAWLQDVQTRMGQPQDN